MFQAMEVVKTQIRGIHLGMYDTHLQTVVKGALKVRCSLHKNGYQGWKDSGWFGIAPTRL